MQNLYCMVQNIESCFSFYVSNTFGSLQIAVDKFSLTDVNTLYSPILTIPRLVLHMPEKQWTVAINANGAASENLLTHSFIVQIRVPCTRFPIVLRIRSHINNNSEDVIRQ
jgi:hypothetical protein